MTTLNVLCGICSEFYTDRDNIYVTKCGHVFHQQCLFHWLKVSHTCPQCRDGCLRHQCHRVYLNFEPLQEGDLRLKTPPPMNSTNMTGHEWLNIDNSMDEELLKTFAFHFGTDEHGNSIYAARGYYNGDLIPGYFCPAKRGVVAPWGFKSRLITRNIEVLDISCDDAEYKWIAASEGSLPENALVSGRTSQNEPLYTARAVHEGQMLYGKLHRLYNLSYMPFHDVEVCNSQYEILVRIPKAAMAEENST